MSEAEVPKRKYLEEMRPAAKRQKDSLWDDSDDDAPRKNETYVGMC